MPTIVLLPGMDGSGMLFTAFIAALGADADVVVVRYPPTGSLGYAELEQFARRSLPAHGDFIILGESFSGPIAVVLASSAPNGLRGVVLCSSFIRNPQPALGMLHALVRWMPVKLAPAWIANYFLLGRFATHYCNRRYGQPWRRYPAPRCAQGCAPLSASRQAPACKRGAGIFPGAAQAMILQWENAKVAIRSEPGTA